MKTVYLAQGPFGIKVIQKGLTKPKTLIFEVSGCKDRGDAELTLELFKQAQGMGEDDLEDLLDVDATTYSALKKALRRVKVVTGE